MDNITNPQTTLKTQTVSQAESPKQQDQKRRLEKQIIIALLLLLLISLGAAGFLAYQNSQLRRQVSQITPTPSLIPTIQPIQAQDSIPFKIIAEGSIPVGIYSEIAEINNFDKLHGLILRSFSGTSRILKKFLDEDKVDSLDLGRHVYIIIGQGEKPTTQFYITIERVYIKEKENEVLIEAVFKDDGPPGELTTRPFIIIEIEKMAKMEDILGGYTFVVKANGKTIYRNPPSVAKPQ